MLRWLLSVAVTAAPLVAAAGLPPLPENVSSFGTALVGGQVYVYGGHTGPAHTYSVEDQSGAFRRLNLAAPERWEELPSGPNLQGLALVAHRGMLYRIGGFTAMNAEGEEHDLRSQATVAAFDPEKQAWEELTPLPEPRSSLAAAVLGDRVYVVGGWHLDGSHEDWHGTAWSADLTKRPLVWERIPDPPFHRRALALAAADGKLFAIGGMNQEDGPTRRTDVFDPAAGEWLPGPELLGEKPIHGFGAAACESNGTIYVSSLAGVVQRLNDDGARWEVAASLQPPRFFHGMTVCKEGLFVVGGANMTDGKIAEPAILSIAKPEK